MQPSPKPQISPPDRVLVKASYVKGLKKIQAYARKIGVDVVYSEVDPRCGDYASEAYDGLIANGGKRIYWWDRGEDVGALNGLLHEVHHAWLWKTTDVVPDLQDEVLGGLLYLDHWTSGHLGLPKKEWDQGMAFHTLVVSSEAKSLLSFRKPTASLGFFWTDLDEGGRSALLSMSKEGLNGSFPLGS